MTVFLGDVVVRARGLARHLIGPAGLARLVRVRDRGALGAALAAHGYPTVDSGAAGIDPSAGIDAAIARGGQRRLAVLARWLGRRQPLFAAVLEEEDRRVLRMLLRHLAADEPPPPLAALAATPSLPQRDLALLVQARSPAALVRRLARAGHPFAPPLSRALAASGGDLLAIETALDRTFAARIHAGARRGGAALGRWVAEEIDLQNAWHALLGGSGSFVDGGRRLPAPAHDAILRHDDPAARRQGLAEAFAGSRLAAVFADTRIGLADLERHALAARIGEARRTARREPLGPAPILLYALRLRAELSDLRHVHWGLAQGLAPDRLASEIVGME